MGSRRKVALIYRQLLADGVPEERLRDIHAPIGLDIGAISPEEIAVSIMAEITMDRLGGTGGPMRDERLLERARPQDRRLMPCVVSAILLAAGESTRMGRQKALLPWGDCATLLEYHLRELASLPEIAEVIVVTGHEPARITEIAALHAIARMAHNPAYKTGKVSSIVTGVRAASADATALMLLAVDQPRSAAVLRPIIDASAGALITLSVYDGRRGHPVVFDASLRDELLAVEEATQGIRAVLQRHAADVREVEAATDEVLLDLNRPEDVAASQGS